MWKELLFRFLIGGTLVSTFALIGDLFKPKKFAGLFGAAPSIALATLGLGLSAVGSSGWRRHDQDRNRSFRGSPNNLAAVHSPLCGWRYNHRARRDHRHKVWAWNWRLFLAFPDIFPASATLIVHTG